ncbi:ABC transporter permease [Candidatus Nitrosocosmicus hydrocola]|uniref:ABC transporter permease n=1 Tax=Candidatus Nitrosocosmicus hydrocola TaxID=1826872 RepID=UPI0013735A2F|nr:ABC transporter permease [Candidatus Nitrosocosmicus hydrocola]
MLFLTYSSLKERRTRNALTILMIVMGCGLLVSLSSLSQGLINFVEQNFKKILPNQIVVSNADKIQESSIEGIRNKLEVLFDQNVTLVEKSIPINNDTIAYLQGLNGVQYINPAYQGVVMINYKNQSQVTNVLAVDFDNITDIIPSIDLDFKQGNSTSTDYVIIPQKIGENLFLDISEPNKGMNQSSSFGSNITYPTMVSINGIRDLIDSSSKRSTLFVPSFLNSTGNPIVDNSIFIDINRGKAILQKIDDYDLLFITYNDIDKVEYIVSQVQKYFNNQVTILNSLELVKSITKFIVGISTFISSIAVISLIVGSIGIVITIYTSVVERTREIGILKALGGTNRVILGMFLTESIFLGIIGAFFGIIFGFIGAYLLLNGFLYFLNLPLSIYPVFNMLEISKIGLVVIVLSIFSGLYPAYKGSKISPVNALSKFS